MSGSFLEDAMFAPCGHSFGGMMLKWVIETNALLNKGGYQFDYVFDWTILKYPQIGSCSSSRGQTVGKLPLNPGPSAERVEKTPGVFSLLV
ncbi:hypothetical protein L1987_29987 [Smallanthus sonchifolius]|uniref:Uncharacterized protein n=1 Tax=Smallanthus sonchifolius TaxID=185202 RepID=A0ACB9I1K2_9ASTR|nr:hypothetical protein L1987_29987 [Smallanthus sonchifolius]